MVFELSQEQLDFQKTVRRFFENECDSAVLRKISAGGAESERNSLVQSFAGLGLVEVFADPSSAKESLSELILFASECGRALSPEHFLEYVVAGPLFCGLALDSHSRSEIDRVFGANTSASILSGKIQVVRSPFFYQRENALTISRSPDGVKVTGTLRLVPASEKPSYIIYQGADALVMVQVDSGVCVAREAALDITQARDKLTFNDSRAAELKLNDPSWVRALTVALIAAEIAGACRKVLEMTTDYLKIRQQFGVAIGSFQALQQPLSDMFLKIEMIDALISFSSWTMPRADEQRELAAQSALRLALREGPPIIEKAIQLHGGIGFTWEHDLHLYLRRVRSLCALASNVGHLDEHILDAARGKVAGESC